MCSDKVIDDWGCCWTLTVGALKTIGFNIVSGKKIIIVLGVLVTYLVMYFTVVNNAYLSYSSLNWSQFKVRFIGVCNFRFLKSSTI